MKAKMNDSEKGNLVGKIMVALKETATVQNRIFDDGIFFKLIFMSDKELLKVSKLCRIK